MQDGWIEKAELALSKGREDLAKAALIEKQKAGRTWPSSSRAMKSGDRRRAAACEADIAKLQNKLREARARQNSVSTRLESAQNRTRLREMYAGQKTEDAFSRFELLERRVDLAEGRADAAGLGVQKSLEEEISRAALHGEGGCRA